MIKKQIQKSIFVVVIISLCFDSAYGKSQVSERKKQIVKEETIFIDSNSSRLIDEDLASLVNLDQYIQIGLARNPGLKAAFYKWKSAFQKVAKEFSLPDPQLSYSEYIDEVETRVGPQERAYAIKQKFPLFDKLWIKKSKAFKASEEKYYHFEKKKQDLIYQITDAHYEYSYLYKSIILTKENMKLLQNFENVAQRKYASGLQQNQDLLKVQVELGKLENELLSLEDLKTPINTRLNTLLDLPDHTMLPWPKESLGETVLKEEYTKISILIDELKTNSPGLKALMKSVETSKESLKLARREYIPDLTVGVKHIDTGEAINPSAIDSGKDPLMLTFSVNIPLWIGRLNAGIRDAEATLSANENLYHNTENELLSKLALLHYKLKDAQRQTSLYKSALIPKATQTLNATLSAYESGKADFLSLIDAQRVLLNFQLAHYRHNANFFQRLAELKSLIGRLSTEIHKNP